MKIYKISTDLTNEKDEYLKSNLTREEKKKILEKHKEATKTHYVKVNETKKGLQKPEEKKVIKKTP